MKHGTHQHWLDLDAASEVDRISDWIRRTLSKDLKRRGVVLGLSGGVDSSVTAALAVRALGPSRVFGLLMPERHSEEQTLDLSRLVAESLGICYAEESITGILESVGFYRRYEAAVRGAIPGYGPGWKSKLVIHPVTAAQPFSYFSMVAESPSGEVVRQRLTLESYLEVLAATNFKQRARKMLEYYHADRLHFAVAGTPNLLEYDQGFFVKNGDGAADLKPIAHLYKTQVYQLAHYLDLPESIRSRPPTTDTYSLPQTQDEFYFALPYALLDLCLYGKNNGIPAEDVAKATGLTVESVTRAWADIDRKRQTTRYLHLPPLWLGAEKR